MTLTPFHLAIPVDNITEARAFYGGLLGCPEGRSTAQWVDFDLFGHQLVCHEAPPRPHGATDAATNPVDGDDVPVPHFGVVLTPPEWHTLANHLKAKGVRFIIAPHVRFEGQVGEQATMFFRDPSGNALEFKAFANINSELFRRPDGDT